jgi:excisionase family DNA binding protein
MVYTHLADKSDTRCARMLIRRLRRCLYDPSTDEVALPGPPDYLGVPKRVAPAPARYAGTFTDVICINYQGGRLHFLADVIGSPTGDPYMSTLEASKLLGVKDRTVRRWAEDGRLDAQRTAGGKKRPGSWRVSVESVRRLLPDPTVLDAGQEARRYVAPPPEPEIPGQMGFGTD